MMTCRELTEHLLDWVAEELDGSIRIRLEEHLQICPHCLAFAESYRTTILLTRKLPCSSEIPDELRQRCEELLRQAAAPPSPQPPPASA